MPRGIGVRRISRERSFLLLIRANLAMMSPLTVRKRLVLLFDSDVGLPMPGVDHHQYSREE